MIILKKNDLWWAMERYRSLKKKPEIVFFGSSAVTCALDAADQLSVSPPIQRHNHWRSVFFEQALKNQLGKCNSSFIFAINGAVASDQYMILATLRQMHCLPKVVIYGITARDLINGAIYYPACTPEFQFLNQCFRVGDYSKIV